MYSRLIKPPLRKSFFLFGPRGTGKTTWTQAAFPKALRVDLLKGDVFKTLLSTPQGLEKLIPKGFSEPVVIDEVQRVPALLNEVHRLIEERRQIFVLTGSSARKLRRGGVNLLAGRALLRSMHPLAAVEMGRDFDLPRALRFGLLPGAQVEPDPLDYLRSYVQVYLEQEVQQEGLTRDLPGFARFLEAASFSQGSVLNQSSVARECGVGRHAVAEYFNVLADLMIAHRIPAFTRRSKRRMVLHDKFYFFDAGVFRAVRPVGPLDTAPEGDGPAAETLFLQNLVAVNEGLGLNYKIHYWRTSHQEEVDFVLYGEKGLLAFEVKRRGSVDPVHDLSGLKAFLKDYPMAKAFLVYGGETRLYYGAIQVWPMKDLLMALPEVLH